MPAPGERNRCPRVELLETRALLSALSVSVTTSQSVYQPGQPIQMTFTETNTSSQLVKVEEGPSIDGFIVAQAGKTVWRSNSGINPDFIVLETLKPGQSLTLNATWAGGASQGQSPVTVGGTFTVTNQLDPRVPRQPFRSNRLSHPPSQPTSRFIRPVSPSCSLSRSRT